MATIEYGELLLLVGGVSFLNRVIGFHENIFRLFRQRQLIQK